MADLENALAQIYVHGIWPCSVPLSSDIVQKLGPYLTRYAQTLKTTVHAVGASQTGNTMHLLLSLPRNLTLDDLMRQLQTPSARYLVTTLEVSGFTWGDAQVESISPWNVEEVIAGIHSGSAADVGFGEDEHPEEEIPAWLRKALGQP